MSDVATFRIALPLFAAVVVVALMVRRYQVQHVTGHDPVVLRPFEAFDTPAGWLQAILSIGGPLLLLDIGLNALALDFVASEMAFRALRSSGTLRIVGLGLLSIGAAVGAVSVIAMGSSWRIGIDRESPGPLVRAGLYRRVRHPIYSGLLLIVAGFACVTADLISLAVAAGALVGIPLQARLEEEFLRSTYGESYERYLRQTGRFWPRIL